MECTCDSQGLDRAQPRWDSHGLNIAASGLQQGFKGLLEVAPVLTKPPLCGLGIQLEF